MADFGIVHSRTFLYGNSDLYLLQQKILLADDRPLIKSRMKLYRVEHHLLSTSMLSRKFPLGIVCSVCLLPSGKN